MCIRYRNKYKNCSPCSQQTPLSTSIPWLPMECRVCPVKMKTVGGKWREMVLLLCWYGMWRVGIVTNDCTHKNNCCVSEETLLISEPEVQWKSFALEMTKKSSVPKVISENTLVQLLKQHSQTLLSCCQWRK